MEMDRENMSADIAQAVNSFEFSARKIDPKGAGKTARKVAEGESVTDRKLKEMAENLKKLREERDSARNVKEGVIEKVTELEKKVARLMQDVEDLKVERVRSSVTDEVKEKGAERVLGFTLALFDGYWYASRKIAKDKAQRNQTIYIGRDKAKAENKIRTWMEKHGIIEAGSTPTAKPAAVATEVCQVASQGTITLQEAKQRIERAYRQLADAQQTETIKICQVRAEIALPADLFDQALQFLAREYKIDLVGGDASHFTESEQRDSYRDARENKVYYFFAWR